MTTKRLLSKSTNLVGSNCFHDCLEDYLFRWLFVFKIFDSESAINVTVKNNRYK